MSNKLNKLNLEVIGLRELSSKELIEIRGEVAPIVLILLFGAACFCLGYCAGSSSKEISFEVKGQIKQ